MRHLTTITLLLAACGPMLPCDEVADTICLDSAGFDPSTSEPDTGPVDECPLTASLSPEQVISMCFAHPWPVGDSCKEPDVGNCIQYVQLPAKYCTLTVCEYLACVEAAKAHPCEPVPECEKAVRCEEAEDPGN